MAAVLHLQELPTDTDERLDDPAFVADLYADRLRFEVRWPEVLAMAVRDGAASVHFHPWRSNAVRDDILAYVVGGTRYGLVPPDASSAAVLLADACRLAAPGWLARLRAWVGGVSVGRVRLVAGVNESDWCVVCWGRGSITGVEFLRISPVPSSPPSGGPYAEPPAAANPPCST